MRRLELRSLELRGRSKELATLRDAYNRVKDSTCTECEIVLVHGYSGTGKSALIQKLNATIQESETDNGYFVSGKFDQQKTAEPYHALVSALNELCDIIAVSAYKDRTRTSFLEQVGSNGKVLLDVIPKLSQIIGDFDGDKRRESSKGSTTAFNQLKYVLRAFVRSVCTVTLHPVVLFLDDLQWADISSLELLESLMMDSGSKRILFIGSYRDNEVREKHPLAGHLDNIGKAKDVHSIQLQNLDLDSVNEIISSVTELDPSSTKPIADIVHQKTNGNIFYVLQLLQLLYEEELLSFSPTLYKWTWDIDKILAQTNLADNVVDLVVAKIHQKLPPKTRTALKLAACLWSTFDVALLREVMLRGSETSVGTSYNDTISSNDDLVSLLDKAADEDLLDKLGAARYKFAHDRIRQAAYALIAEGQERDRFHHWIGGILRDMTKAPRCEEWVYFAAADQSNRGAALITDDGERVELAKLNLIVAEKAISLSAFVPASSYLESGIQHLPKESRWKEQYDLTLRLHNAMADMEHCTGNWEPMQVVVDEILANAKCFEDKMDAYQTLGVSLLSQSKQRELIELCKGLLRKLGEQFPARVTKAAVALESIKLKRALRGTSDRDLLLLPLMTNESKLSAAKFFDILLMSQLYLGKMRDAALVAIKMMRLTLRYGLSGETSLAFVFWGEFLVCQGDLQEGYRFGKLALKLVEKFGIPKAHVVSLSNTFLIHWKEPLQNTLDLFLDAHKNSMLHGDITYAFQCIVTYQFNYFASGLPLSSGAEDLIAFSNQMKEYSQHAFHRMQVPVLQMMLNLIDRSKLNVLTLTGEVMDQDEFENIESNPHQIGVQAIASCRMQLAYYFGDLDLAAELSKKLQNIPKESVASASYLICVRAMFFGLISIALARKTKKRKHAADALRTISTMENKWVKRGAVNCLHKYHLLKAEYATLKNGANGEEVKKEFDLAISTARRVGFIQDEALANERAGVFFLQSGDEFWASSYLSRAHELYSEWGAKAKTDQLETTYEFVLPKQEERQVSSFRGRKRFTDKSSKSHKSLNTTQLYGTVAAT